MRPFLRRCLSKRCLGQLTLPELRQQHTIDRALAASRTYDPIRELRPIGFIIHAHCAHVTIKCLSALLTLKIDSHGVCSCLYIIVPFYLYAFYFMLLRLLFAFPILLDAFFNFVQRERNRMAAERSVDASPR